LTTSSCTSAAPAGSYALTGASGPTLCPAGTFGSSTGLSTPSCSGQCTSNYWCAAGSITSTQYACPLNTISSAGSDTANSCTCKSGYQGLPGQQCYDIYACENAAQSLCINRGVCTNTLRGFFCIPYFPPNKLQLTSSTPAALTPSILLTSTAAGQVFRFEVYLGNGTLVNVTYGPVDVPDVYGCSSIVSVPASSYPRHMLIDCTINANPGNVDNRLFHLLLVSVLTHCFVDSGIGFGAGLAFSVYVCSGSTCVWARSNETFAVCVKFVTMKTKYCNLTVRFMLS
jgi:hypothetical protein